MVSSETPKRRKPGNASVFLLIILNIVTKMSGSCGLLWRDFGYKGVREVRGNAQ